MNILSILNFRNYVDIEYNSEEEKQNILDKINSKYKFLCEENGKLIYDQITVKLGKDCIVIRKALHDIDEVADYYVRNRISASFTNNIDEIYSALAKRLGVDPNSNYVNNEDFILDYDEYEYEVTLFFKDDEGDYDFSNDVGIEVI